MKYGLGQWYKDDIVIIIEMKIKTSIGIGNKKEVIIWLGFTWLLEEC
jgi:hypothetical protein